MERFLAEAPMVENLPSYQSMLIDAEGSVWLERYRPSWEHQPDWDVVSSRGEWLGAVSMPVGFASHQIGPDFILGVACDEVGVERAQSYALLKEHG
jgi:hypothetical protein